MMYCLMHKDVYVADIVIDEADGTLLRKGKVYEKSHMPVGTVRKGIVDGNALRHWWAGRSIPASRDGIEDVLRGLGIPSTTLLIEKCMGLSLSDQYWIRPRGSDTAWADVNFFENEFSEDMGDLLLGARADAGHISMRSPDNTSDGVLRKRWKIFDGRRCLVKAGSGPLMQEPFNEAIASILMGSQGIDHVEYSLAWQGRRPVCICEDFIGPDTELVTGYGLTRSVPKDRGRTTYALYVSVCEEAGIDIVPFLDRMLAIDYIMMNGDRHMNNFGLVRDAETLEYLGPAPVYDTGTSLGCDVRTEWFPEEISDSAKPFESTFEKQLGLVSDLSWFDGDAMLSALPRVE
ncbi:MAG: hypothetical protein IKQ60_07255 [Candidatus Methanomethylophilaceae archaeon]|nr:hypothetical protein [Candidatus Methanomethylophilaceae archaeon]